MPRPKRIHDTATIKANVKERAERAQRLRREARSRAGKERWELQHEARSLAKAQRTLLLAYGYLRGKSVSQMESQHTRLDNLPYQLLDDILRVAKQVFLKGPEAPEQEAPARIPGTDTSGRPYLAKVISEPPGWTEFAEGVKLDLQAWSRMVKQARTTRKNERSAPGLTKQRVLRTVADVALILGKIKELADLLGHSEWTERDGVDWERCTLLDPERAEIHLDYWTRTCGSDHQKHGKVPLRYLWEDAQAVAADHEAKKAEELTRRQEAFLREKRLEAQRRLAVAKSKASRAQEDADREVQAAHAALLALGGAT